MAGYSYSNRPYEPHRPLNPASSRLCSVPPRYYDVIDYDTNEIVDSDLHQRMNRSRSVNRNSELRDGWRHPGYNDLVVGSRAHPGHHFPRSSSEYCRDMIISSRSSSPIPVHINNYNKDLIADSEEKIHTNRMRAMYPETFRGQSSVYNYQLGRYLTSYDSPGFRYYRYTSPDPVETRVTVPRFSTRCGENVFVPSPPIVPMKSKRH